MMPYNTELVREWHPPIVDRRGTGEARGPQELLLGDVEGPIYSRRAAGIEELGHTAPKVAGLGGIWPRRLQERPTSSH